MIAAIACAQYFVNGDRHGKVGVEATLVCDTDIGEFTAGWLIDRGGDGRITAARRSPTTTAECVDDVRVPETAVSQQFVALVLEGCHPAGATTGNGHRKCSASVRCRDR